LQLDIPMPRHTHSAKGPSQRQLRVGELIRHTLAEIFARGEVHHPDLEGLSITVSEVRVSPDLKHAAVFVAPLGGGDMEAMLRGLSQARKFLRGQVGRRIETKFTPDLKFIRDTSYDEASAVDALLRSDRVARDLTGTEDDNGKTKEG
jgi:ribosome-binding factor A